MSSPKDACPCFSKFCVHLKYFDVYLGTDDSWWTMPSGSWLIMQDDRRRQSDRSCCVSSIWATDNKACLSQWINSHHTSGLQKDQFVLSINSAALSFCFPFSFLTSAYLLEFYLLILWHVLLTRWIAVFSNWLLFTVNYLKRSCYAFGVVAFPLLC